jgi:putative ABC transport system substrate-binding protein
MRRREFIAGLGSAAAWPVVARGQQTAIPVVGFMSTRSSDESANYVAAFRKGLDEVGFVEDRNVAIEYRWAEGKYDLLPAMAIDFVRRQVNVIVAIADPSPQIAKAERKRFQSCSSPMAIPSERVSSRATTVRVATPLE